MELSRYTTIPVIRHRYYAFSARPQVGGGLAVVLVDVVRAGAAGGAARQRERGVRRSSLNGLGLGLAENTQHARKSRKRN